MRIWTYGESQKQHLSSKIDRCQREKKKWSKIFQKNKITNFCFKKSAIGFLIIQLQRSVYDQYPEAVFLVMCDPPMNEL